MNDVQMNQDILGFDHAVAIILKGFEYMCGGFILTPCEVTNLLGIMSSPHYWHLDPKVNVLQQELGRYFIDVEVNSQEGMSFHRKRSDHPRYRHNHVMLGTDFM